MLHKDNDLFLKLAAENRIPEEPAQSTTEANIIPWLRNTSKLRFANEVATQIICLLIEAQSIISKYAGRESRAPEAEESTFSTLIAKLRRIPDANNALTELGRDEEQQVRAFRKTIPPWDKIKWAVEKEKSLKRLLSDIKELISDLECLEQASPAVQQDAYFRNLLSEVLRSDQATALKAIQDAFGEIPDMKEIALAATIKLNISNPEAGNTTLDPVKSRYWQERRSGVTLEKYGNIDVLVEWRSLESPASGNITAFNNNSLKLASVFAASQTFQISTHSDCHIMASLPFLGCRLASDETGTAGAFAYRLPEGFNGRFKTLHDLLPADDEEVFMNADHRRSLAFTLSRNVYRHLVTGWLHKGIRSHNIYYFRTESSRALDIRYPYLLGYDFAREDKLDAETFKENIHDDRRPYLWPEYVIQSPQPKYCAVYDIYSLGVVLWEIGTWSRANATEGDWFNPSGNISQWRENVYKKCGEYLEHDMGTTYAEVVLACLKGDFRADGAFLKGQDLAKAFDARVLVPLSRLLN